MFRMNGQTPAIIGTATSDAYEALVKISRFPNERTPSHENLEPASIKNRTSNFGAVTSIAAPGIVDRITVVLIASASLLAEARI